MITYVLTAMTVMVVLAGFLSLLLVVAHVWLVVEIDPRQSAVEAALPQANCGGCGFPSCSAYAQAVVAGHSPPDRCTVGGPSVALRIATLLGIDPVESHPIRPVIHCGATVFDRLKKGNYIGERSCAAANVVGGVQGCTFGCLGFGDCVRACQHDAMELIDGLPRINYGACIGCGACVRACPRSIIEQIPITAQRMPFIACSNLDPGKVVRQVCRVGCLGCGTCARLRPELFGIRRNLAVIDYTRLSGDEDLEPVLRRCPTKSLAVVGMRVAVSGKSSIRC